MNKKKVVIDTLGNGKFILVDSKKNTESIIPSYTVLEHYFSSDNQFLPIQFTKKATDEIQNAIEDELHSKEKSSAASYASTNAKVFR